MGELQGAAWKEFICGQAPGEGLWGDVDSKELPRTRCWPGGVAINEELRGDGLEC
jgi:hypothetical protein